MSNENMSLRDLFMQALRSASDTMSLSAKDEKFKTLIDSALSELNVIYSRIESLHLFSSNEQLEDLSTKDMIYIMVPFVIAEVELRAPSEDRFQRMRRLRISHVQLKLFLKLLDDYSIVPEEEKKLYSVRNVLDPATKRATKIAQFKKEKELKEKIIGVRGRFRLPPINTSNSFDVVLSLFESLSEDEDENEIALREATLLLLRLSYGQALAHLDTLEMEVDLLRNAPDESRGNERDHTDETSRLDTAWRLDAPQQNGPLLDAGGKILRPFTILPAGTSERARMTREVFQAGHRLPSMNIDEYLEIERQRGNIITGGGSQSAEAPTRKEQMALDAEMDGTVVAEEKAEALRVEEEEWATWKDAHPRGAGNTMNRG